MFNIELLSNYCDMDALIEGYEASGGEFDLYEPINDWYEHYINGEFVQDECPEYLLIYYHG